MSISGIESSLSSVQTQSLKKQQTSTGFPGLRRQLSEEEEKRLEQLTEMLTDLLAQAVDNPSGEQRARIRDIENEIAKITGEKPKKSLAASTKGIPGQDDDETKENALLGESPFLRDEKIRERTLPHKRLEPGPGTLAAPLNSAMAVQLQMTSGSLQASQHRPGPGFAAYEQQIGLKFETTPADLKIGGVNRSA
jgi:hypothetical protein